LFREVADRRVAVAAWQQGHGPALATATNEPMVRWRDTCGCLKKLFTGALIVLGADAGRLDLDGRLTEYLPAARRQPACFQITLRQLLEHRHGLDDSMLVRAPRESTGSLDAKGLVAALGRRQFEPGTLYSYSNAGAWLCAALLEAQYGKPYASLLADWAERHGISVGPTGAPHEVCPALGGRLSTTLPALLRVARLLSDGLRDRTRTSPLPGWNPLEQGSNRAFKHYGGSWYGHRSTRVGASAWLRIHPEQRIAIVIDAGRHSAALVGIRLFANRMPDFAPPPPPRHPAENLAPVCGGRFGTRATRVDVIVIRGAPTRLRWNGQSAALRAGPGGIFYTDPPALPTYPFIQLVRGSDGSGPYLWNGRSIFARITE
jgi:CubicO group peptidase (beta-lactamase class C family)